MAETTGTIAENVTASFTQLSSLVTGASYVAGTVFAAAEIGKFKVHKDNPTQVPISTPIALLFVSAAVTFLAVSTSA